MTGVVERSLSKYMNFQTRQLCTSRNGKGPTLKIGITTRFLPLSLPDDKTHNIYEKTSIFTSKTPKVPILPGWTPLDSTVMLMLSKMPSMIYPVHLQR